MSLLTKDHIKQLITHFYAKIKEDDLLGPIFNDVAQVDWDHHIPLLCQFWNNIMLKTNEYHGNAYMKHVVLGKQVELTEQHFSHWLALFSEQAHLHLPPTSADTIIERAHMIAKSLKMGCVNVKNIET